MTKRFKPSTRRTQALTVLSYGESRSGKTRFAATFPRPLFLSEAVEGGWTTIGFMRPEEFYDGKTEPDVIPIATVSEMEDVLDDLPSIADDYDTVVFDSLTFYANLYVDWFKDTHKAEVLKNKYSPWDAVLHHVNLIVQNMHHLGKNVVWLCLQHTPESGLAGPQLPGQMKARLPAACNFLLYHAPRETKDGPVFEVHTKPYRGANAGDRLGDYPGTKLTAPNYRSLIEYIEAAEAWSKAGPQERQEQAAPVKATTRIIRRSSPVRSPNGR